MAKNTKDITIYFHLINKEIGTSNLNISSNEIKHVIDAIKKLPVDIHKTPTRFFMNAGVERCILFDSDSSKTIPQIKNKMEGCIHGLYFKRRNKNYPYENDGTTNLFEISLSDNENELAEITYFILDIKHKILLFVSNRYAGSINDFEDYINKKFKEACTRFKISDFKENNKAVKIIFPFILNENSEADFNGMTNLSSMDIKIGGNLSQLEPYITNEKNSGAEAVKSIINFCQEANSQTITISIGVGRTKEEINKKIIKTLYQSLKKFLKHNPKQNSFKVKGCIDTETRFLDLVKDEYFHKTTFTYAHRYLPLDIVFENLYDIHKKYIDIFLKQEIIQS